MPQRRTWRSKRPQLSKKLSSTTSTCTHFSTCSLKEILGWQTSPMLNCFQFTRLQKSNSADSAWRPGPESLRRARRSPGHRCRKTTPGVGTSVEFPIGFMGHGAMVHPRCYTQLQGTSEQLATWDRYNLSRAIWLWVNTFIVQFLGAWIFIYQQKNDVHQAPGFWPIPIEKPQKSRCIGKRRSPTLPMPKCCPLQCPDTADRSRAPGKIARDLLVRNRQRNIFGWMASRSVVTHKCEPFVTTRSHSTQSAPNYPLVN